MMEPHWVPRLLITPILLFFIVIVAKEDKIFHSAYFRHENKVHATQ